jgi:hypothetical protein
MGKLTAQRAAVRHAAATCYSVRNAQGKMRYFTAKDEQVLEHANYQEAFGSMLLESHPTMRIEVKGQSVAPHRFNLCWTPLETYSPRSAEQLAAARAKRERNKSERAERKWAKDNPLFADLFRSEKEEDGIGNHGVATSAVDKDACREGGRNGIGRQGR